MSFLVKVIPLFKKCKKLIGKNFPYLHFENANGGIFPYSLKIYFIKRTKIVSKNHKKANGGIFPYLHFQNAYKGILPYQLFQFFIFP